MTLQLHRSPLYDAAKTLRYIQHLKRQPEYDEVALWESVRDGRQMSYTIWMREPNLESVLEILELKKSLRKAELQRQLDEFKGIPISEQRLSETEHHIRQLTASVEGLKRQAAGSPLTSLL
jgi:hypothetical protein